MRTISSSSRSSSRAPIQRNFAGADLCRRIRRLRRVALPQSVEEGRRHSPDVPLSLPRVISGKWKPAFFASLTWVALGVLLPVLGRSRRMAAYRRPRYPPPLFIAGGILAGTASGKLLGRIGTALQMRAAVAAGARIVSSLYGRSRPQNLPGCRWPFFPPPQAIIEVYTDDLPKLLDRRFGFRQAAAWRLRDRRGGRFPDRRGRSGGFAQASATGFIPCCDFIGAAAGRRRGFRYAFFTFSLELEREHVPDRTSDGIFRSRY